MHSGTPQKSTFCAGRKTDFLCCNYAEVDFRPARTSQNKPLCVLSSPIGIDFKCLTLFVPTFFKRSANVSQMITEHFKSHFSRLGVAIHRSWCIGVIVAESGDRLAENSKLNICRVLSGDTPSFWCWILVVADGSCLRYILSRFLPVDIYESYFRV